MKRDTEIYLPVKPHIADGFMGWAGHRPEGLGKSTRIGLVLRKLMTVIAEADIEGRSVDVVIDGEPLR